MLNAFGTWQEGEAVPEICFGDVEHENRLQKLQILRVNQNTAISRIISS
jgi:hypothetical protein